MVVKILRSFEGTKVPSKVSYIYTLEGIVLKTLINNIIPSFVSSTMPVVKSTAAMLRMMPPAGAVPEPALTTLTVRSSRGERDILTPFGLGGGTALQ